MRALASRSWFGLIVALGLGLCAGCRTPIQTSLFKTSGPGWQVQQGQAVWHPGPKYPGIAGEIVVATNPDGRSAVQFTKTPIPVVVAQRTPRRWLIQFPPRNLSFTGRGSPPTRLVWLYLPAALAGDRLPRKLRFQRKPDGDWRLENTRTGESLEGFLTP